MHKRGGGSHKRLIPMLRAECTHPVSGLGYLLDPNTPSSACTVSVTSGPCSATAGVSTTLVRACATRGEVGWVTGVAAGTAHEPAFQDLKSHGSRTQRRGPRHGPCRVWGGA